jgi:hypothetical protein
MESSMSLFVAMLLATGAQGAAAETPAVPADPVPEANPVICKRFTEIGSRLKSTKVCQTQSEWDEQRRAGRQSIERSQTNRPTNQ